MGRKIEIEISDDTAAELDALRATRDCDDETFWSAVLHNGIDLMRFEDEQETPEAIAAEESAMMEAAAARKRERREWEAATLPDVVASAAELTGDNDAYGRNRPGPGMWVRLHLDNPQVRLFAWLELVRKARALRLPVGGLRADASNPEHKAAAREYVASLVLNDFHANWSELVWGQHRLLFPEPEKQEIEIVKEQRLNDDEIPF